MIPQAVSPILRYRAGSLLLDGHCLDHLARTHGTPLYVYSRARLHENFEAYDRAFGARPHLVCYAVKANSSSQIIRELAGLGAGADITSIGELFRATRAGVRPDRIVYAGVGKREDEIRAAIRTGILMFNVESAEEAALINAVSRQMRTRSRVAVRVNPHVVTGTHAHISTGEEGTKFGVPAPDVPAFVEHLRGMNSLEVCGLHTHIGSQITSVQPFAAAVRTLIRIHRGLRGSGTRITHLNIGGGLGIRYHTETPPTPRELLDTLLPLIPEELTIIAEPGRRIVGDAGVLLTRVLYRKRVGRARFIIVDASMTDLIRPAFYDAYHNIVPVRPNGAPAATFSVVGPVCETSDFLGKNRTMPEPEPGDTLAVECTGAYGFAMSSNYNSRCRAAEILVCGRTATVIRDRDTLADLVRNERR